MLTFICQYWVELLFSLIVAGAGIFFKRYIKLERENREREREEFKKLILNEIDTRNQAQQIKDARIQNDIDLLKKGVLSFQGKMFKDHCRDFLNADEVNLDEFEDIEAEHSVYNSLGGNHEGDVLYGLAQKRVEDELIKRHNK